MIPVSFLDYGKQQTIPNVNSTMIVTSNHQLVGTVDIVSL